MKINEEKREKFIECAGKRVNNVLHDMQILEPMARSSVYDFTKEDIAEMFTAMQETLDNVKAEFEKKFEEKARNEKKVFSFGNKPVTSSVETTKEDVFNTAAGADPIEENTLSTVTSSETANPISDTIPEFAPAAEDLAAATSSNDNLVF